MVSKMNSVGQLRAGDILLEPDSLENTRITILNKNNLKKEEFNSTFKSIDLRNDIFQLFQL